MIIFHWNFEKTLHAAGVLLREHHGRMDRIRLLKLLYIADRELLTEMGRTLTGDTALAMKRGPVLRGVYGLIKSEHPASSDWQAVVKNDHYEVVLAEPVGTGRLTKAEHKKLLELCERFRDTDSEELSELTHEFPEWIAAFDSHHPDTPNVIAWEAVLEANGDHDLIAEVERDIQFREMADMAFGD
jgi:uncharacterized phage-associated protein